MTNRLLNIILLSTVLGAATASVARADCESDLKQLEQAFKTPNLKPEAKAALDEAKAKAVPALKKDDDKTCHTVIVEGMTKAGMALK